MTDLPRTEGEVRRIGEIATKFEGADERAADVLLGAAFNQEIMSGRISESGQVGARREALQAHKSAGRLMALAGQAGEETLEEWKLGGGDVDLRDLRAIDEWIDKSLAVSLALEKKFGVMRMEPFRSKVVREHLRCGERGTLIVADLVGLKIFNTYGHEVGDDGLMKVADFFKRVLTEDFGVTDPELCVARKGDEFYVYIPTRSASEVVEKIQERYAQALEAGDLRVDTKMSDGLKEAIFYWRVADVTEKNFDRAVGQLDMAVEVAKHRTTMEVIDQFETLKNGAGDTGKLALLLRVFMDKRIPMEMVEKLMAWGVGAFREWFGEDGRKIGDPQALDRLWALIDDKETRDLVRRVQEKTVMTEEKPVGRIVEIT